MSAEIETERLKDVVRDIGERIVVQLERIAGSLDALSDLAELMAERQADAAAEEEEDDD